MQSERTGSFVTRALKRLLLGIASSAVNISYLRYKPPSALAALLWNSPNRFKNAATGTLIPKLFGLLPNISGCNYAQRVFLNTLRMVERAG
jgi:hypothetical protein